MSQAKPGGAMSLDAVRQRIDAIDDEILKLVDERSALARVVAQAKRAAGDGDKFALRPARETSILRRLLAAERKGAGAPLVVRVWREMIGDNLANQGPYHMTVWGGRDPTRMIEMGRARFGTAAGLQLAARPEDALAQARTPGGIAVCALTPDNAWWGRLLAEPKLRVFDALPCLNAWGPLSGLAVAAVDVEPTGDDRTYWVTDAPGPAAAIEEALGRLGVAGDLIADAGGLKLFALLGFYQADDARLANAPGRLSGVIGAAPSPLDV